MTTTSDSSTSLTLVLLYFFFGFLTIFICIYILHKIWNEKFPPLIPIDGYKFSANDQQNIHKIETLGDLLVTFYRLLISFDDEYWLKNCGFDAFSYLYYQRRAIGFLVIWLVLLGLDLLTELAFKQVIGPAADISDINLLLKYMKSKYQSTKEVVFICLIACIYLNKILNLKFHMQDSFINSLNREGTEPELNWLRLRTVHCKGLLLTDVKGTLLKRKIKNFLESIGDNGKILSIVVFPDYSRLLHLEKKRLLTKDLEMIYTMEERKPSCFQRCFPETFNSLEEYERKFTEVERKMKDEIEGMIESSGQCFICFNNLKTAEICLQKFATNSVLNIIYSWYVNLRHRCCFKRNANLERGFFSELQFRRKISTFTKYSESIKQEEFELDTSRFFPIMTIAPDPYDINWLNISSTSLSFLFCRRLFTNLLIFCILVFLTTPLALFQVFITEFSMDWINYIPHPFNEIIKSLLPSLFVVLVNQLILLVIDYSSELESFSSFSGYQNSNLGKATFYMLLNLLLIPVITMGTAENLILAVISGFWGDLKQILVKFYSNSNLWSFFLMLLLEQGVLSFLCYVLRLKELFLCLGDVTFAHYKRTFLNEKAIWRRDVDDVFQYGYFSAQMIVCLTITLFFGYQYPILVVSGIIYFLFRHIGDAYNILVVNKNEMNSHGKFIQLLLIYSNIPIILFLALQIGLLILNQKWTQLGFAGFVFLVTALVFMMMNKNLYTTKNFEENEINDEIKKAARKWQEFYQHPLIVPGFERFQEENEKNKEDKKEEEEKEMENMANRERKKRKGSGIPRRKNKILNLENFYEY